MASAELPPCPPNAVEEITAKLSGAGLEESDGKVLASAVLAKGVRALEPVLPGLVEALKSSDKAKVEGALSTIGTLATNCPGAEAYIVDMLVPILESASHKQRSVQFAAQAAVKALGASVSPNAVGALSEPLFVALDITQKWQTRTLACEIITSLSDHAPAQLGYALPSLVPEISPVMGDTKKQVKDAASASMTACCDVVGNRDMEHMTGDIVKAIQNPKEVPEIMHNLAGVAFVQSVERPALAMVVPLLLRGLAVNKTATRRQSSVIIENMSKLVDDPRDSEPFLPLLMPALEKATAAIADPEARGIADRAFAQLTRLDGLVKNSNAKSADHALVLPVVKEALKGCGADDAFAEVTQNYLTKLCMSIMDRKKVQAEEWEDLVKYLAAFGVKDPSAALKVLKEGCEKMMEVEEEVYDNDDDELCNCTFTLAYGTKILLHNTKMRLLRGHKYGLLGGNDSGKTTLMRSIANGSVEGFPDSSEVRTVFVEADIQGEQSHLSCVDYVMADERISGAGIPKDKVVEVLNSVGFTEDGKAKPNHAVSTLSGGWRMKLALARCMLQNADILLLDEPTNHLDVINVAWVKNYINSLKTVTCIMVSHDSSFLNDCCTDMLAIDSLKLNQFKGNLNEYVKEYPAAQAFFKLSASKLKFTFPQPGPIEGIKSRGKALMKMSGCDFTYPGNTTPTLFDISVIVSMASRVACVGENGAGKSTMIKVLTGEVIPQTGEVWRHPNARVAYVAQHAFHHIEAHMDKTPNEYIRWRYANNGEDKESLVKVSMVVTEEEEKLQKTPFEVTWKDEETSKQRVLKKVVAALEGGRRQDKNKDYLYEVRYIGSQTDGAPDFLPKKKLEKNGWAKAIKAVDARIAQRQGLFVRTLSSANVEKHLADCGLIAEFATHTRMQALSGGQKVKVVLAAAMWNQPHIVILDEPTNYLDRESLGALASAIEDFSGGVVIISHNNEFVSTVCPEEWVMDSGHLTTRGLDGPWMDRQDEKIADTQQITEMTDASGNTEKIKQKKKLSKREQKQMIKRLKDKIKEGQDMDTDEEEFAEENGLYESKDT